MKQYEKLVKQSERKELKWFAIGFFVLPAIIAWHAFFAWLSFWSSLWFLIPLIGPIFIVLCILLGNFFVDHFS
jgi:fatty acid desaturase